LKWAAGNLTLTPSIIEWIIDVLVSHPAIPANTCSNNASNTSAAIGNDGVGVAGGREGTRFVVKREDSPLHRKIGRAIFIVVTDTGADVVGTADSQAGGIAMLDHYKAGFTILVQHGRVTHILIRDDTLESQEAVPSVLERSFWFGDHSDEHVEPDLGAKVDDITLKIGGIDLGGVNLNDSKVLGALPRVKTKLNGGGK